MSPDAPAAALVPQALERLHAARHANLTCTVRCSRQPHPAHHSRQPVALMGTPAHPTNQPRAVRKRRGKSTVGKEGEWEYLVGEAPARWNPEAGLLRESGANVGGAEGKGGGYGKGVGCWWGHGQVGGRGMGSVCAGLGWWVCCRMRGGSSRVHACGRAAKVPCLRHTTAGGAHMYPYARPPPAAARVQPIFVRQDTRDAFVWRIRNLPYPADVYRCAGAGSGHLQGSG